MDFSEVGAGESVTEVEVSTRWAVVSNTTNPKKSSMQVKAANNIGNELRNEMRFGFSKSCGIVGENEICVCLYEASWKTEIKTDNISEYSCRLYLPKSCTVV